MLAIYITLFLVAITAARSVENSPASVETGVQSVEDRSRESPNSAASQENPRRRRATLNRSPESPESPESPDSPESRETGRGRRAAALNRSPESPQSPESPDSPESLETGRSRRAAALNSSPQSPQSPESPETGKDGVFILPTL